MIKILVDGRVTVVVGLGETIAGHVARSY